MFYSDFCICSFFKQYFILLLARCDLDNIVLEKIGANLWSKQTCKLLHSFTDRDETIFYLAKNLDNHAFIWLREDHIEPAFLETFKAKRIPIVTTDCQTYKGSYL